MASRRGLVSSSVEARLGIGPSLVAGCQVVTERFVTLGAPPPLLTRWVWLSASAAGQAQDSIDLLHPDPPSNGSMSRAIAARLLRESKGPTEADNAAAICCPEKPAQHEPSAPTISESIHSRIRRGAVCRGRTVRCPDRRVRLQRDLHEPSSRSGRRVGHSRRSESTGEHHPERVAGPFNHQDRVAWRPRSARDRTGASADHRRG